MRPLLVSISFDDGREDTYSVAMPIMEHYNIVPTLHITTGYIDGTYTPSDWFSSENPMSIQQVTQLKGKGVEITSHGDKHVSEIMDYCISMEKLKTWGVCCETPAFSIPGSKLPSKGDNPFVHELRKMGVKYIRGGRSQQCYSIYRKSMFVMYSWTKRYVFYKQFNSPNRILEEVPFVLPSVIVRQNDKVKDIMRFIDESYKVRSVMLIFMFHSIKNKSSTFFAKDVWCWDTVSFDAFCKGLSILEKDNKIRILPIQQALDQLI